MKPSILADKSKFIELASSSLSMREMLENAGLRAAGGNFAALKRWAEIHGVAYPRGMSDTTAARGSRTKWLVDNVFVTNCKAKRGRVKQLIIQNNLLPYECSCGLSGIWQGKPLVLQLEHKNGVHDDNRLENLEFLCPNCHSQTETFAGKKKVNAE